MTWSAGQRASLKRFDLGLLQGAQVHYLIELTWAGRTFYLSRSALEVTSTASGEVFQYEGTLEDEPAIVALHRRALAFERLATLLGLGFSPLAFAFQPGRFGFALALGLNCPLIGLARAAGRVNIGRRRSDRATDACDE